MAEEDLLEKPVEIRVAGGIYHPDRSADHPEGTGEREASFDLISGVILEGGYAGLDSVDPNERNVSIYSTILSGDLADNDDNDRLYQTKKENSIHVITASNVDSTGILDGFTITAGKTLESAHDWDGYGGGMFCDAASPVVRNCVFVDNTAAVGGGIANIYGSDLTVENCKFFENTAFSGGGIYNYQSDPNVHCCIFEKNHGRESGGAMYNRESCLIVTQCDFIENIAGYFHQHLGKWSEDSSGGAIVCLGCEGEPVFLIDCTFSRNSASSGGGIALGGSSGHHGGNQFAVEMTNCLFVENYARCGGGINNGYGYFKIKDSCFVGNYTIAEGALGGAIVNGASEESIIENCRFQSNSSEILGGALALWGGELHTLRGCVFEENFAGLRGGAVYQIIDEAVMEKCSFVRNISDGNGGAYCNYGISGSLVGCVFSGNKAQNGAAVFQQANGDEPGESVAVNCTFVNNAATAGAALQFIPRYISQGGNGGSSGTGGRNITNQVTWIPDTNSMFVEFINCIIRNDSNEIMEKEVVTVSYSNVRGGFPGEGNIDVDPCFVREGFWDVNGTSEDANDDFRVDGDYHLKSQAGRWEPESASWVVDDVTSPCIDAGDPASPIGRHVFVSMNEEKQFHDPASEIAATTCGGLAMTSEPFPNGGRINMGAYGGTAQASKSWFGGAVCNTIVAGDINGDCRVDMADIAIMFSHWLDVGR